MNIINDFFFLSWSNEPVCLMLPIRDDDYLHNLLIANPETFYDNLTIALAISEKNVDKLLSINCTKEAIDFFVDTNWSVWEHSDIYAVQCRLLSFLIYKGDLALNKEIGQRLDRLRKAEVLGYDTSRKLISLLTLIEEKREKIKKVEKIETSIDAEVVEGSYYDMSVAYIHENIEFMQENLEDNKLLARLENIPKKLDNQKFSIGITGVMNAGKSTMLNALLGEEILGTSVVPETANLSIIKYATEPKAVVNFWKASEWQSIERSADTLESMKHFVADTQDHFGAKLSEYIVDNGKSVDISIDELPSYTSAEHSDKKCNLVRSVELYSDLEFVKNGVEIVDTPGLDDPVIQREEITKSYLLECDLMCHLMNVGQSATQKDVEFIIDTLLYHNVAQLLVVITRIDMVSSEELEEVISYTKSSIKTKLESLGKSSQFDTVLDKIHFIPIAGKMALLHRTNRSKEALELGYDLQKSGILDVEDYLRDVLFGDDSQKAKLIIASTNKELLGILKTEIGSFKKERELLGKSAEEISRQLEDYHLEISQTKENIEKLNERIIDSESDLKEYFVVLDSVAKNKLQTLRSILKRRVMDDVSYTLRKEKKKPTKERITTIIETGIQDGFIDLLRDYRYQFQKRVEEALEKIERDFSGFNVKEEAGIRDAKAFFEEHFSGLNLINSNLVLIEQVNQAIATHSKKQLDRLDSAVDASLEEAMDMLYTKFGERASVVQKALLLDFHDKSSAPLESVMSEMQRTQSMLEKAKERVESKTFNSEHRKSEINDKLKVLESVQKNIIQGAKK